MTTPAKQYSNEWDANTGWWAEKPLRDERPSSFASFGPARAGSASVWRNAALIVGLVFALMCSLIALAAR